MNKDKLCLNAAEVSNQTGMSISSIRKLTRCGEIPHIRVGRRILYPVAEIEHWLKSRTIGGAISAKEGDSVEH